MSDSMPDTLAPPPPPPDFLVPPPPPEEDLSEEPLDVPKPPVVHKPAKATKPTKVPLSIEDLLQKKKAADDAASKPKFLSKSQREELALQKRSEAIERKRRRVVDAEDSTLRHNHTHNNTHHPRSHYNSSSRSSPNTANGDHNGFSSAVPTGPRALRQADIPTGPAAMRNKESGRGFDSVSSSSASKSASLPSHANTSRRGGEKRAAAEEAQAALIKQRYMGADTNTSTFSAKKKRRRTTERKFNFEWNAEEDTSQDYNPLYQQRAEINFYGRGRLAGFGEDVADKIAKKYARALEEVDHEAGSVRAKEMMEMERKRKEESNRMSIDRHWSEKRLDQMRERDWRIFKEDFNISTKGGGIPNPMRNWQESSLPSRLLEVVHQVGYADPSPIQRAAIPIALQARDLIGVAVTGSGKTAAFLLPLLVYISELPTLNDFTKNDGPYAIILAPTRELAQQIEIEAKKFATPLGFTCVSIVGGHSLEEQAYALRDGAEIIIATPGRLVDCIERRVLVLAQCCYVIMDEADRMIDLGFEEPVNKILDALPVGNEKPDSEEAEDSRVMSQHLGGKDRYRQTMMYTATMPPALERIARKYLRRPAIITIGNIGEAVDTVEQRVEFISGEDKRKKRLADILQSREFRPPIIVFVNIKRNCDAVARDIKHMGFSSVTLHGSKTQEQREAALASVRSGQTDVLVATDLAGRGIDVPDVSLVVNFNMATNIESYTHRIGRTGRAGKSGVALTFLGNEDRDVLYDLKQMLMKSERSKVPEELRRHEAAQNKPQRGMGGGMKKQDEGAAGGGFGNFGGNGQR